MHNKKVVVIGAGGIVGQHMMVNKPEWADAIFTRRKGYLEWSQLNVGEDDIEAWLDANSPDVIINLAGQNVVDAVEQNPDESIYVNVKLPLTLATWVSNNNKKLIQVRVSLAEKMLIIILTLNHILSHGMASRKPLLKSLLFHMIM
jgi:dTDP-4-dehydrorhamnose reductase